MDLANTIEIIPSTIVFLLKVTRYLKIHIWMIMKIKLKLLTLIINLQGLLKNQVSQAKEVVLMMMQPNVFLVLVYSALEDKKRGSPKLKLLAKMIYGCKL
jgi:hypothetical protein